jgi:hypothetical protein
MPCSCTPGPGASGAPARPAFLAPHLEALRACWLLHRELAPDEADNLRLKYEHSLRVLDEAVAIVATLDPAPAPDLERAILTAALLHDMGRFPQLVLHGTFNDRASENHGVLGARTLVRLGLPRGLDPGRTRLVRACVAMHNRKELPAALPPDLELALHVVRDADKLDILPVVLEHLRPGAGNDVVTLGLSRDPGLWSPALLESLLARRPGRYEDMRSVSDFRLLLLSWAYGMRFAVSRRALLERGLLRELAAGLPDDPPLRGLYERLRADLERGACGVRAGQDAASGAAGASSRPDTVRR